MKIRYDKEADALYIKLREAEYYESDEIQEGFILDTMPMGTSLPLRF